METCLRFSVDGLGWRLGTGKKAVAPEERRARPTPAQFGHSALLPLVMDNLSGYGKLRYTLLYLLSSEFDYFHLASMSPGGRGGGVALYLG